MSVIREAIYGKQCKTFFARSQHIFSAPTMKSQAGALLSLKIIAFLFIAIGFLLLASELLMLADPTLPDWNVLRLSATAGTLIFCASIIGVGVGLLRLSPKSRHWALAAAWIIMGLAACTVTLITATPQTGYLWRGQYFQIFPSVPGIALGTAVFALFYWKYCVLIHVKTRRLFESQEF